MACTRLLIDATTLQWFKAARQCASACGGTAGQLTEERQTVMAYRLISPPIRMLAGAALLTIARLAAPASSQTQSVIPERALLNQTSGGSANAITRDPPASAVVDGEGALLNTRPSGESAVVPPLGEASTPVDGATALRGEPGGAALPD